MSAFVMCVGEVLMYSEHCNNHHAVIYKECRLHLLGGFILPRMLTPSGVCRASADADSAGRDQVRCE